MNAKDEMKFVRNFLRRQIKLINKDPFLSEVKNRISARIVKRDASSHKVYICVRDIFGSLTRWNSGSCRWISIDTAQPAIFWKWKVYEALNEIIVGVRAKKSCFDGQNIL